MTTTTNNPVWNAALRAACVNIATDGNASADLRSRASEIADGARIGAVLTDMNVEFISAMRSRFMYSARDLKTTEAERNFDTHWDAAWKAANPAPAPTFADLGDHWDSNTPLRLTREGFTFEARLVRDDDSTPPWKREDGHGEVSEYVNAAPDLGWWRLTSERGANRWYNLRGAKVAAEAEGWGPGTPDEAARADFARLEAWCNDVWCYVGVCVVAFRAGVQLTGDYGHALWGIDSDAGAYLAEVADQLLPEALTEAREKLADLLEGDAA